MPDAQPIITVRGEHVALGPMRRDLIPLYQAWINNVETSKYLGVGARPLTLDEEVAWFESIAKDQRSLAFTIYRLPDHQPIGVINLLMINAGHRTCELGVMIGEQRQRHHGLGTEAVRLAVDYAFHALNLHSVMLETYAFNHAGQVAYERAGFREIGRRREARYHAGRYWDIVFMDILASEFDSPALKALMTPPERR